MARIRTIKPDFFTSEDIVSLQPMTRLLYIALWCEADREGRMEWKPKTFKMRYFPADSFDIDASARELLASGLVVLYAEGLAYIPKFQKHQHLNPRESASTLPCPDASARVNDTSGRDSDVQGGREGKGRKGKVVRVKREKTPIPENFVITDELRHWATEKGHVRLDEHLEAFRAKCAANGYAYADWHSAFQEAVRANWAKLEPPKTQGLPGGGRRLLA